MITLGAFVLAAAIRAVLFTQGADHVLQRRIEVTTPANSFRNVLEGIDLINNNISVYDGDTCHIQYHYLLFIRLLLSLHPLIVPIFFILCDLLAAQLLGIIVQKSTIYLSHVFSCMMKANREEKDEDLYVADFKMHDVSFSRRPHDEAVQKAFEESLPSAQQSHKMRQAVTLVYLFNPFSMVSCLAMTTTTLDNVLVIASLYTAIIPAKHSLANTFVSMALLATAAANSMHLAMLVLVVATWNHSQVNLVKHNCTRLLVCLSYFVECMFVFGICFGALMVFIYMVSGDALFLKATFGFVLTVPDLQPNLGLFWYFFTQVFDHFRLFFTWIFQVNVLVYLFPLTVTLSHGQRSHVSHLHVSDMMVQAYGDLLNRQPELKSFLRFKHDPLLLGLELLVMISIFKPYPSLADAAVYTSIIPSYFFLEKFLPHTLSTLATMVVTVLLAPVMWSMWIHVGSANANFFFAVTLFYNTAQVFILTDFLYAHIGVLYACRYGYNTVVDTKPVPCNKDMCVSCMIFPHYEKEETYDYRIGFNRHLQFDHSLAT